MADGRQLGKIEKSPYLSNGLTDRREIWHSDTYGRLEPSRPQNFHISKIHDGGAAILKIEKWPCLSNGFTDRREIWHSDAF